MKVSLKKFIIVNITKIFVYKYLILSNFKFNFLLVIYVQKKTLELLKKIIYQLWIKSNIFRNPISVMQKIKCVIFTPKY